MIDWLDRLVSDSDIFCSEMDFEKSDLSDDENAVSDHEHNPEQDTMRYVN